MTNNSPKMSSVEPPIWQLIYGCSQRECTVHSFIHLLESEKVYRRFTLQLRQQMFTELTSCILLFVEHQVDRMSGDFTFYLTPTFTSFHRMVFSLNMLKHFSLKGITLLWMVTICIKQNLDNFLLNRQSKGWSQTTCTPRRSPAQVYILYITSRVVVVDGWCYIQRVVLDDIHLHGENWGLELTCDHDQHDKGKQK